MMRLSWQTTKLSTMPIKIMEMINMRIRVSGLRSISIACLCSSGIPPPIALTRSKASLIAVCIALRSSWRLIPNREARTTLLSRFEIVLSTITKSIVFVLSLFACRQLP